MVSHCLKFMLYEPLFGSFSALKLSKDMPNLPSTVLPNSFNLPESQSLPLKSVGAAAWQRDDHPCNILGMVQVVISILSKQ